MFDCPTAADSGVLGNGVRFRCSTLGITIYVPGLDIESTSEAVLTLQRMDLTFAAKDLVVTFGPVSETEPDANSGFCVRGGDAPLTAPSPPP
jgi:hypothetical protein